jgi:DNA-binding GntR family transcriptional regulator
MNAAAQRSLKLGLAKPAPARTAIGSAFERLRADILRGDLAPGEKLRIQDISRRYKSGAIPLREALNRLTAEALVVHSEQRGFTVAPISQEALLDLTRTRTWLNEIALRESIAHGDAAWEERLIIAYHRMTKEPRYLDAAKRRINPAFDPAHRAFHLALISACGSAWLLQYCEQLFDHADRYRYLSRRIHVADRQNEHAVMLKAALKRDADAAIKALTQHMQKTSNIVLKAGAAAPVEKVVAPRTRRSAK